MDDNSSNLDAIEIPTKQRIINAALELFSANGYSETSIRDIAAIVGIRSGSIYAHFSSKEEILWSMLNDYSESTKGYFHIDDLMEILQDSPTVETVYELVIAFPRYLSENAYFSKLFHLVHQEQHRNDMFGNFEVVRCQAGLKYYSMIVETLKKLHVIADNVESSHWSWAILGVMYMQSHLTVIQTRLNLEVDTFEEVAVNVHYLIEMLFKTGKL
ncbi:MAG: TetR/AcrR family transcriptional regulator [Coriobacteriia bacterium]|nr:TetR/AcrR family transcriptional regulator [Coriobacteriia bacterium]